MKYFKENDIDIPKYSKYCSFVKQDIVFKKDKATLHVISKRCKYTKHF